MGLDSPLIGNWTAWEIGNGKSVRIGEDPWAAAGEDYKLPITIINKLREHRCFKLANAKVEPHPPQQRTKWKIAKEMGMEGNEVESQNNFVNLLEINFINFDEEDHDKLIWIRNSTNGDYTAKKGYEMEIFYQTEGHKAWW